MRFLLFVVALLWTPFVFAENSDIDIQQRATNENKNIAIYFSGSDWCINCHQFSKSIINQDSVGAVLNEKFIYYNADFPQRKKLPNEVVSLNESLAEKLNPNGEFPVLVIADKEWNVVAKIYKGVTVQQALDKLMKCSDDIN